MQLLLCYDNEGVYVNTMGRVSKNIVLQWGEMPTSVAYIGTGQIMGWGNKAIEVRNVNSSLKNSVYHFVLLLLDPFGRNRSPRWCIHAQESPTTQVLVRTKRQGVLQQCQRWFVLSDLLHDAEQTRNGQLVTW